MKKPKTDLSHIAEAIRHLAVPIESLHPDPANARAHGEQNIAAITASLRRFGQRLPLVVQRDGMIVRAGNGRLAAARAMGWTHIAAVIVDEGNADASAFALADNRTSELAEWDDARLAELLKGLPTEIRCDIGFSDADMKELLASLQSGEVVEDEAPEPLPAPVSVRGDLWLMGGHRLLCGDSTDAADVALVMNGERAAVMNTDPPYGVGYANADRPNPGVAKPRVANDGLTDKVLQSFLESAFRCAKEIALVERAAWYLWHAHLTQGFFAAAAAAAANVVLHRQIIWVKPVLLLTRGQYHWKHEPCFFGWVDGHQPPDFGRGGGERDQTTVWEVRGVANAERKDFNHSTPKPVGIFAIPIVKHTVPGDIVYEPFCGSGPQIIAAEQLARRCFGSEIEPRYVDVSVRRWQKLTGNQATHAKTGRTWAQTASERGVPVPP